MHERDRGGGGGVKFYHKLPSIYLELGGHVLQNIVYLLMMRCSLVNVDLATSRKSLEYVGHAYCALQVCLSNKQKQQVLSLLSVLCGGFYASHKTAGALCSYCLCHLTQPSFRRNIFVQPSFVPEIRLPWLCTKKSVPTLRSTVNANAAFSSCWKPHEQQQQRYVCTWCVYIYV